jgi:hypothetical protein
MAGDGRSYFRSSSAARRSTCSGRAFRLRAPYSGFRSRC